jgi:hypothetical protein
MLVIVCYMNPSGFMPTPGSGAIGSLELPDGRRRELALTSRTWACPDCLKQNHAILTSSTQDTVTSQPVGLLKSETDKGKNKSINQSIDCELYTAQRFVDFL